jgi:hypothetical protein
MHPQLSPDHRHVPIRSPGSQIDRRVSIAASTARKLVFGFVSCGMFSNLNENFPALLTALIS